MSASVSLPSLDHHEQEVNRLRAELSQQERNLRLLREVALMSRGGIDPLEVFDTIYQRLAAVLPIDAFFVALCDSPDSKTYHFALFIDEGERVDLSDQSVGGLTGWILEIKQARLFRDLHRERGTETPDPQQFGNRNRRSRSWIGVPLMIGRASVGVISIQSYDVGVYGENDLELIETLATWQQSRSKTLSCTRHKINSAQRWQPVSRRARKSLRC